MSISVLDHAAVDRVAELLGAADSVLFVTGAGISADSGLPTYRGIGGLYDVDDTEEGLPIEVLLSGQMMQTRPELTWKYLGQIAAAARGTRFNRGHEVIALLERRLPRVWTLTQNVDGFHGDAGAENVIEIHGNMRRLRCPACAFRRTVTADDELDMPPECPGCGAIVRPDVVLFGELLPEEALATLNRELYAGFDLVIAIGTTAVFPYIAEPVLLAHEDGKPTVEINPGESEITEFVDVKLTAGAAAALDAVWARFCARAAEAADEACP